MASKKKTVQLVVGESGEITAAETEQDDYEEIRALLEMEGADEAKFIVWSTLATKERPAGWVGEYTASELTLERLAQDHGKGKYRIKGMKGGQFVGQKTITIASVPKSLQPQPTQTLMPAGSSSTTELLALLEARSDKQSENMLKWAAILTPLLAPVLTRLFEGQKGTTLTELTTALANVKALDGGGKVDQMEEFTKLLSLVKEVQGDGAQVAGSNWVDVVRDGIQGLPHIVAGVAAAAKGHAIPAAPANGQAQPAQLTQEETMLAWLKRQLEALTFQASMNKDPGLYAEVMLDNLPAGADIKQLNDYLSRADWWALLTSFSPGVQPYPQWFAECREELLKGLSSLLNPPQALAPKGKTSKPAAKP